EAIGSTTSVKPQAEANTRTLSTGSSVYSKELIHTEESGVANLRFHDNSNLSVGPKSSVRLDKFLIGITKCITNSKRDLAGNPRMYTACGILMHSSLAVARPGPARNGGWTTESEA